MRKIIFIILVTSKLFSFEPDWIHDYDKALQIAKTEHKDIYLFIAADKCTYCKKFKNETLSKKYIMDKINKQFVPIYLSRDQHKIPSQFQKFGAPRHYFLSSNGKIYDEATGFVNPTDFLLMIKEAKFYKE